MSKGRKLFLIHWNLAEAEELARKFEGAGWQVEVEAEDGGQAYQRMKTAPADILVIYLNRLPSHGRETAHAEPIPESLRARDLSRRWASITMTESARVGSTPKDGGQVCPRR